MRTKLWAAGTMIALSGCASGLERTAPATPVAVRIIAFNDFHGTLEPPGRAVEAPAPGAGSTKVPAGGAAYLATAIDSLRAVNPNHVVVSAGDLIGASPLVSALFLDEPTIAAMNLMRVDFNAVGNHEFDRGRAELLRMQNGGCARHTPRPPCQLDPAFPGARFGFLAANTLTENGTSLFPPWGMRSFGRGRDRVSIAFVGLTLRETATLVTPAGVAGLSFADEADTVNALIPVLRAAGADAIVLLIHQGVRTTVGYNDKRCGGLTGPLLPVLARLDPAIDVIVSGHTHRAYVCDYGQVDPTRRFLLTSAGLHGMLLTDISIEIDPRTRRVTRKSADNLIVQGEAIADADGAIPVHPGFARYQPDPAVAALVARAAAAAGPHARRVVGRLAGPATQLSTPAREQSLGALIADAQLAATRAPARGAARIAFMNRDGVRADLIPAPDGSVTFGQLFAVQPFGNSLVVKSFTGRQIRAALEQQFSGDRLATPYVLLVSQGFGYRYDLSRPAGRRIIAPTLDGVPLDDDALYRVAMSNFLASGGDGFSVLAEGADAVGGGQDVDALEAYIASGNPLALPVLGRIADVTPR